MSTETPRPDRARGMRTDYCGDLRANDIGRQVGGTIDDALQQAGSVAQVDEGEVLTVLTTTSDPPAHDDLTTDVVRAQITAIVRTHTSGAVGAGGLGAHGDP